MVVFITATTWWTSRCTITFRGEYNSIAAVNLQELTCSPCGIKDKQDYHEYYYCYHHYYDDC